VGPSPISRYLEEYLHYFYFEIHLSRAIMTRHALRRMEYKYTLCRVYSSHSKGWIVLCIDTIRLWCVQTLQRVPCPPSVSLKGIVSLGE
jgi:hypothetical protein